MDLYNKILDDINNDIKHNPYDAFNYRYKGLFYVITGDYSLALTDYNSAVYLEPECEEIRKARDLVKEIIEIYENNKYDLCTFNPHKIILG